MRAVPAKVAVVGVGNCASVFLQGLQYYSGSETRGLWHPTVGGLRPKDLRVVAAFDIDRRKVGRAVTEAALRPPNVARKYVKLDDSKLEVSPGILKGDPPPHLRDVSLSTSVRARVTKRLEESGAEILVNMISSGSDPSTTEYAGAALDAGCAFVNCTPTLLLRNRFLASAFAKRKLPLVGDDMMSQFGGTVFHKGLLSLMVKRGVKVSKSYQLDVGGGSETLNTIDENIKMAKRDVKTESVAKEVPYKFETVAGTTDYVDYMGNERTSYFWLEGAGFMDSGVSVDVYLRSSDGANAGNVLFDVLRATAAVQKSGRLGAVTEICGYGFKSPSGQGRFDLAYEKFAKTFLN